ncbi:MAG: T9SS type A sorting domain-containing protein [Sphingobacteriales bacterium JAD_PAG50586_3]|nr:MAG: T9SS type A sorting domain-containing protein [Sphingobacteriales bacterium JAD_PAG50586_3]
MKKTFTLTICLLSLWGLAKAQAPVNLGFETWTDVVAYEDPDNWGTLNFASLFVQGVPTTAEKTTDSHSDSFAVKLVTKPADADLNSFGLDTDTVPGLMIYGSISSETAGTAYTQRPTGLQFWYKYTPVNGDSAGFLVQLTKWDNIQQEQILVGQGAISMKDVVTTYTLGDVPIVYEEAIEPDSLFIILFSSFDALHLLGSNLTTISGQPGSTLIVDDIAILGVDTPNAIKDNAAAAFDFTVYPNPASTTLNFKCNNYTFAQGALTFDVIDLTGRVVQSVSFNNTQTTTDVSTLAAGMYIYRLTDKTGILKTGKFNVAR